MFIFVVLISGKKLSVYTNRQPVVSVVILNRVVWCGLLRTLLRRRGGSIGSMNLAVSSARVYIRWITKYDSGFFIVWLKIADCKTGADTGGGNCPRHPLALQFRKAHPVVSSVFAPVQIDPTLSFSPCNVMLHTMPFTTLYRTADLSLRSLAEIEQLIPVNFSY